MLDDDELWRAFHDRTLAPAQWTHAAHLRMRAGILRLNAAHGLVESPERGYHETLTRVWLVLVRAARRQAPDRDPANLASDPGLARTAPLAFYSRDRLFSLAARAIFVPPDLAELP
jgi:hypothetical protein